jgi:hypothetical protein
MANHRFCDNIGRSHRSNGVYYQLDLLSRTWHQRCWDADCRYFRSKPQPIPTWIVELELEDAWREEQMAEQVDDNGQPIAETPTHAAVAVPDVTNTTTHSTSLLAEGEDELDWDAMAAAEHEALATTHRAPV